MLPTARKSNFQCTTSHTNQPLLKFLLELLSKELKNLAAIWIIMPGSEFDFYERKKIYFFQKEKGNTFTVLINFIVKSRSLVKSLQKEQNSTNLLLWPPICRNKHAITPKWFNSLDTNSTRLVTFYFQLKNFPIYLVCTFENRPNV